MLRMASPPTFGRRSFLVALVGAPALLVVSGCASAENDVSSTTAPASEIAGEPVAGPLGGLILQVWRDPG